MGFLLAVPSWRGFVGSRPEYELLVSAAFPKAGMSVSIVSAKLGPPRIVISATGVALPANRRGQVWRPLSHQALPPASSSAFAPLFEARAIERAYSDPVGRRHLSALIHR